MNVLVKQHVWVLYIGFRLFLPNVLSLGLDGQARRMYTLL